MIREANIDLIGRLMRGVFPYPILLVILAATTSYPHDHPILYWASTAAFAGTIAMRIFFMGLRKRIDTLNPMHLSIAYSVAVLLASGASGLLYAGALWFYGFEAWTFTITMMWMVGQTSGGTISFTPSFMLLQFYLWPILGPALCIGVWLGNIHGYTFAIATLVLSLFLVMQGRRLNVAYWRELWDRAREKARTRELEVAKTAAEAANHAKSQFLANMSHEIRTPMHGVLGMAQIALTADTHQESNEHIQTLYSSAEGLLHVINDILDFSKVEAGKLTLEEIPFSLRDLMGDVRNLVAPQAAAKGLKFACQMPEHLPAVLGGDPARLRQVLINLLGNAIKFTPSGSVTMQAEQIVCDQDGPHASLHFRVRDTGIGIPQEKIGTIFEAFGQADSSVTRRFGGTGLGLTISAQLVQLMGGRIWVESTPGMGSTFQFTCSFTIPEAMETASPRIAAGEVESPMRIMLAEDNPVNQKIATAMLGKHGHQVKVVSTGVAALKAWEAEEFDVILMDNQMPEMDGVEAVRQLREREALTRRKRTPVVALSASAMIGDRERFLSVGMDVYLAKPFRDHELYALLRQVGTSQVSVASPEAANGD